MVFPVVPLVTELLRNDERLLFYSASKLEKCCQAGWPKSKLEHRELSLVHLHPLVGGNCSVGSHGGGEVW